MLKLTIKLKQFVLIFVHKIKVMINGSPYWNVEQYIVFSIYTKKQAEKKDWEK
jgi:hypothetical protein